MYLPNCLSARNFVSRCVYIYIYIYTSFVWFTKSCVSCHRSINLTHCPPIFYLPVSLHNYLSTRELVYLSTRISAVLLYHPYICPRCLLYTQLFNKLSRSLAGRLFICLCQHLSFQINPDIDTPRLRAVQVYNDCTSRIIATHNKRPVKLYLAFNHQLKPTSY